MAEKRILVGQIGAAHGIRGEVRVKSFTEPMEALADYGPLASEDGSRTLTVQRLRPNDTVLVVKFREVPDRNAAEALNGTRLFVDREALPATDDEETFYHSDLIGLRAEDADGTVHGTILAVANFGAGDLLEIQPPEGSTVYLPFTRAFAPVVDLAGGRVVIAPPEGLFGGGSDEAEPKPAPRKRRRHPPAAAPGPGGEVAS
ncbi:ribosome maturation factor RimM [Prosthecomicrobium sp. N25]|uniref:ribosome maturation factor RimM n=1 Tax=Prosthecomicrobium sp. N25 TaxID=3129254 RepID=UPI003077917A